MWATCTPRIYGTKRSNTTDREPMPLIQQQRKQASWLTHWRITARIQFSTLNTILHTTHHLLDQYFSTGDDFAPQGTSGHVQRHFWLLWLGRGRGVMGSYWRPVGRDQGCRWTSYTGTRKLHNGLFSQKCQWCWDWETPTHTSVPVLSKNAELQDQRHHGGVKGHKIRGKRSLNLPSIYYIQSSAIVILHASSHLNTLLRKSHLFSFYRWQGWTHGDCLCRAWVSLTH